jgi:large-conductance mechanosensitive channel
MVFIVFAALAGLINYELNHVIYTSAAPASLFEYNILTTMLPFLLAAVISFVLAYVSAQAAKSATNEKTETTEAETQQKLL